jgi:hypothetical protein
MISGGRPDVFLVLAQIAQDTIADFCPTDRLYDRIISTTEADRQRHIFFNFIHYSTGPRFGVTHFIYTSSRHHQEKKKAAR